MSLDVQMERLCALYDEKGDEELQGLFEGRDDLTEVAQQALAQTMRGRGLVGRVGAPVEDEPGDDELERAEIGAGEVKLCTFEDAFEADQALRVLEDAGVWHRLAHSTTVVSGDRSQLPVGLTAIVREGDFGAAVALLREKMGLFPKAEVGDGLESPLGEMQEMVLLAMFDRSEGLIAAEALGRAGISYCWRDGAEESQDLPDDETVAIEVRGGRLEEANGVVEKATGGGGSRK